MSGALTSGCRGALSYDFTPPNCERPAQLRNYGRYQLILSGWSKMRHHLVKPSYYLGHCHQTLVCITGFQLLSLPLLKVPPEVINSASIPLESQDWIILAW